MNHPRREILYNLLLIIALLLLSVMAVVLQIVVERQGTFYFISPAMASLAIALVSLLAWINWRNKSFLRAIVVNMTTAFMGLMLLIQLLGLFASTYPCGLRQVCETTSADRINIAIAVACFLGAHLCCSLRRRLAQ